jgi:hypothetical protein
VEWRPGRNTDSHRTQSRPEKLRRVDFFGVGLVVGLFSPSIDRTRGWPTPVALQQLAMSSEVRLC